MNMRLIGAPTLADVVPSMVDTSALTATARSLTMYEENCEHLHHPAMTARRADTQKTSECCLSA